MTAERRVIPSTAIVLAHGAEGVSMEQTPAEQRQLIALDLVTRPGATDADAARALGVSEVRVRVMLHHLCRRLGVSSRAQAARLLASELERLS